MAGDHPVADADAAVDAGAATAIRRARRSFGVSMAILVAGLMAVAFAVVYRLNRDADPAPAVSEIALPAGAEIISAVAADGRITLTYRLGGATAIRVVDARTGAAVSDISIVPE
ncbi:MAG TPA: DUF6476 family protein [Devosiaceae bacterium]|nr:DUF6476 family protein [Devosiaceae bacterium]